jgi:adenine-specific DNA-methyltransferase
MLNKEQSKEEIRKLVEDFRNNFQKYKKLSESDVETKLIEELFIKVLNWDKNDFFKQEKVYRGGSRGRADYIFYINERPVFVLEVKKIGIALEKGADKQVISYALSKRIPFAVSTNFEELKIFCVEEADEKEIVFRVFSKPEEYLEKIQDLSLLSKESFTQDLLLKEAVKEGRLKKRITIDKRLLEDFMRIRSLIANDIEKNYTSKYSINEKDDIVQRIIDRLIFIRKSEDSGINPDNLMLNEIPKLPGDKAYSKLKQIFSKYDEIYNSGLFTPNKDNDCDKIKIDGEIIKKLINYLYESYDKKLVYNFDWIDADVLGQVYEQYLGKILAQTKSGRAKLKEGQAHRKEQGIYYTPTYIVDYIVKNTVGELLKDKKTDASKIRILDPACGSGSFLIKAFDYLQKHLTNGEKEKQQKLDSQGSYSIKTEILKNNIFGVDLDNKAVEITKLNLLLKAAEKFRKLPKELDNHICWGNSLIDDETISKQAFKWTNEFQEGTFDVVIGNPPYVRPHNINLKDKEYFWKNLKTFKAKADLYNCFMEKGINLMKNKAIFSFIVPYTWTSLESFYEIRKFILNTCKIIKLVQLPKKVFQEATVETCIFVLSKESNLIKRNKNIIKVEKLTERSEISVMKEFNQSDIYKNHLYNFQLYSEKDGNYILNKIKQSGERLGNFVNFFYGLKTGDDDKFIFDEPKNKEYVKLIRSKDVRKYNLCFNKKYVWYVPDLMIKNKSTARPGDRDRFEAEKIIVARMGKRIVATFDNNKYYVKDGMLLIKKSDSVNLKYLTGLLNSKIINYYYKNYFITIDVLKNALLELPILFNKKIEELLIILVDRMLSLNKQLQEIGNKKTVETAKLEEEITKTDKEIDELVYKIYGITEEEKNIIEESLR